MTRRLENSRKRSQSGFISASSRRASAAFPRYSPGYAVFNQEGYGWTASALKPGGYGYVTILHEIGHLFGLDHPWDEGAIYREGDAEHPEPGFPGATSWKSGVNGLNQGVF